MVNKQSERFITLDVFRGITIFLMIIVNTPGGGAMPYPPLEHAQWNGCTLTDLVFPSFLFAVGNAMSFSMKKFENQPQQKILYKILKRTLLIFIVGYLLTWYTTIHFENGRRHRLFQLGPPPRHPDQIGMPPLLPRRGAKVFFLYEYR